MHKIKNGFTLIELLAVILILGVITLIAVPVINKVTKSTRIEAEKRSVERISNAIEEEIIVLNLTNRTTENIISEIEYSGKKPDEINILSLNKDKFTVKVVFGNNCYVKKNDSNVEVFDKDKCPTYNYSTIFKENNDNIEEIIEAEKSLTIGDHTSGIYVPDTLNYPNAKITEIGNKNVYQGTDPANYLVFGKSCFRILNYNDNEIRISFYGFDASGIEINPCLHMYYGNIGNGGGYFEESAFGNNNNWFDENNIIRNKFENYLNDTNISSKDNMKIGNVNTMTLSQQDRSHLIKGNFNAGDITESKTKIISDNAISEIQLEEQQLKYYSYIGLPTVSDYLNASSDLNCKNYNGETNRCDNENFLNHNGVGYWTANKMINADNQFIYYFPYDNYNYKFDARFRVKPILILNGDTLFTGSGTFYNPYRIF